MIKTFMTFIIFTMTLNVFAKSSVINCSVFEDFNGKDKKINVEFSVSNLGKKNTELLKHPKAELSEGLIYISPKEIGGKFSNLVNLNGQGGDLRVSEDRIRLFGDGDGYTFVDLVLFKNHNYEKGYVRVYGSGDQMYQKINCRVRESN